MPRQRDLYAVVFTVVIANAVCRPLWQSLTTDTATFNSIPFICAAAGVALWHRRMSDQQAGRLDILIAASACVAIMAPYASWCWLVLSAIAGVTALCGIGCPKALLVLIITGLRLPASETTMAVMGGPILTADSTVATLIADLIGNPVVREDNMLINEAGHTIFIMSGCSSFANITDALLVAYVSAVLLGNTMRIRAGAILAGLAIAILGLNAARLAFMTLSPDAYTWVHDGPGATLSQAAIIAATMVAVWLLTRPKSSQTLEATRVPV